jgi:hypothetical protein
MRHQPDLLLRTSDGNELTFGEVGVQTRGSGEEFKNCSRQPNIPLQRLEEDYQIIIVETVFDCWRMKRREPFALLCMPEHAIQGLHYQNEEERRQRVPLVETACMANPLPWSTVYDDLGASRGKKAGDPVNTTMIEPQVAQQVM